MNMPNYLKQKALRAWGILWLATKKFYRINGTQWAGAFAFNAFFSLFPLIILLVTLASFVVDRDLAGKEILTYMESYVPISGEMQKYISTTLTGVINARGQASVIASLILIWLAIKCFTTLIYATNHAWDATEHNWWRLPLRSLILLGIAVGSVFLGTSVPVLMRMAKGWVVTDSGFSSWVYALGSFAVPLLVLFFGLCLFYRLASSRPTRFAQVWVAALCATVLLRAGVSLFVIYLNNFASLNALYGTLGGIMALLLWIYLCGCIFIFGSCLGAALNQAPSASVKTAML